VKVGGHSLEVTEVLDVSDEAGLRSSLVILDVHHLVSAIDHLQECPDSVQDPLWDVQEVSRNGALHEESDKKRRL
jgi:hypothetical protein